jgi:hypothetical protein
MRLKYSRVGRGHVLTIGNRSWLLIGWRLYIGRRVVPPPSIADILPRSHHAALGMVPIDKGPAA